MISAHALVDNENKHWQTFPPFSKYYWKSFLIGKLFIYYYTFSRRRQLKVSPFTSRRSCMSPFATLRELHIFVCRWNEIFSYVSKSFDDYFKNFFKLEVENLKFNLPEAFLMHLERSCGFFRRCWWHFGTRTLTSLKRRMFFCAFRFVVCAEHTRVETRFGLIAHQQIVMKGQEA